MGFRLQSLYRPGVHVPRYRTLPFMLVVTTALVMAALAPAPAAIEASSGYDVHQGVDKCGDQSHRKVADLWNGTPFYAYSMYLGGAEAGAVGCISTSAFVSYVRSVGFAIAPLWDDLQAPCSGQAKLMSSNTTTAHSQGVTSANNAKATASAEGFASFDNLWLDIEPFDESNSSCRAAVHAYVEGWDSVLNPQFAAGVYMNVANVDSLWALTSRPDSVSIADWTGQFNTVWGFSQISNTHWTNDQRIHQYRGNKTYSLPWGCSGSGCTDGTITVDVDCIDGWVSGGTFTADQDGDESAEGNSVCRGDVRRRDSIAADGARGRQLRS